MNGVIDVFVTQQIAIQMKKSAELDRALLSKLLEQEEIKIEKVDKSREYTL